MTWPEMFGNGPQIGTAPIIISSARPQGVVENPQGPQQAYDPRQPYMPQRAQRGGSFLCNESYCSSYRASARMHSSSDTGQDHVGFRGVMTQEMWEALKSKI